MWVVTPALAAADRLKSAPYESACHWPRPPQTPPRPRTTDVPAAGATAGTVERHLGQRFFLHRVSYFPVT
jgi:hypothetical protein